MRKQVMKHQDWTVAGGHPTPETIDRWRCELLDPTQAHAVMLHVRHCPDCQRAHRFGAGLASELEALPLVRRAARRHPPVWRRLAVPALVAASLVGALIVVELPRLTGSQTTATVAEPPEVADAIRHQDFYRWLARHPQLVKEAGHEDSV